MTAALIVVALVAIVLVLEPVFRRREEPWAVNLGDPARAPLVARRARLLDAIRDADFELAAGKLTVDDHQGLRAELARDAASVLGRLDALAPTKGLDPWIEEEVRRRVAREAHAACAQCGRSNPQEARFCDACGGPLGRDCAACGAPLRPAAAFCGQCGAAA